jgi:hypothetical protein
LETWLSAPSLTFPCPPHWHGDSECLCWRDFAPWLSYPKPWNEFSSPGGGGPGYLLSRRLKEEPWLKIASRFNFRRLKNTLGSPGMTRRAQGNPGEPIRGNSPDACVARPKNNISQTNPPVRGNNFGAGPSSLSWPRPSHVHADSTCVLDYSLPRGCRI